MPTNELSEHQSIAGRSKIAQRRARNREILQECKRVCEAHKGLTQIDDRFVVVDLTRYNVSPRGEE